MSSQPAIAGRINTLLNRERKRTEMRYRQAQLAVGRFCGPNREVLEYGLMAKSITLRWMDLSDGTISRTEINFHGKPIENVGSRKVQ